MQALLPDAELIVRIILGFTVGALIGLERQKKMTTDTVLGVRSFGLHSLFGALAAYSTVVTGNEIILIYAAIISGAIVTAQMYYKLFRAMGRGLTTTIAFALSFVLGTLVGFANPPPGQLLGPLEVLAVTISFVVFLVLGFKEELAHAVEVITREEMVSAVELAVIILLFWPLIPATITVGPIEFPLFQTYLLIVILLSVSFVNYLLVKKYRDKGVLFFGFFGGLANSEATVSSVTDFYVNADRKGVSRISLSVLLANLAMVLRNGILLVLVDTTFQLFQLYLVPIVILVIASVMRMVYEAQKEHVPGNLYDAKFSSPFEFGAALRFGAIFGLVYFIQLFLTQTFSEAGVLVAALIGGFVSAGAVVAGSAALFYGGSLTLGAALGSVLLATAMSILNKTVYVYLADRESGLLKRVARDSIFVAVVLLAYFALIAMGLIAL